MEVATITFKLELLANMVQELNYLSKEFPDDGIDIVEDEFDYVLEKIRELKIDILEDLDGYFETIKANNEPVYLPYWTVRKELREANF